MFLKSIQLKNFRGFSDAELDFETAEGDTSSPLRKTTVLLGNNGTGKSNLLKAIGLILAGRSALAELLGEPDSWIQYRKAFCEISAVLRTQAGEIRSLTLRIDRGASLSDVLDRNKESLRELDLALKHTERSYFVVGYGASRRLSKDRGLRGKGSAFRTLRGQSLATLFSPDAALTSLEAWAMDVDYRDDKKSQAVIRLVLRKFLREISFAKIDKEKGQLLFRTADGLVPLSYLSEGYQNVAAWVGDLLFRITETFGDYSKPLDTRGLLLIDEVDLHLHPLWQRELLVFLERQLPNMQLVATTHSPITAQQAQRGELHFLTRRDQKIRVERFAGDPSELLLHQLVMSDVFGLPSDESKALSDKKSRYESLKNSQNPAERDQAKTLGKELAQLPARLRSNGHAAPDQIALLRQIQRELEVKRQ